MATAQVSHFGSRSVGCGFKHAPQHFDAVPSMFRGMTRVTWSCLYFWAVSVSGDITTECCESSGEDLPSFLQVTVEVNRSWRYDTNSTSFQTTKILNTNTSRSGPKFWQAQAKTVETGHEATLEKEKVTPVLHLVSEFSKGVIVLLYAGLSMMVLHWMLCGLPKKAPQHESVQDGCDTSWAIFLCITFALTWSTTDQYAPSLPQMGVDLSGSQAVMSATVQSNFVVKSVFGLFTASLSDRIGRRPAMVSCLCLLTVTTLCCGCATRIEWFFAGRFLQGIGESVEPVILASCRDYFNKPEDRLLIIAAVQVIAVLGQSIAPVFGAIFSALFDWRFTFFLLSFIWGSLAFYCWRYMLESCPNLPEQVGPSQDTLKGLRKILAPGIICLLLTNGCVNAPFSIFNSNIPYVAEVSYGLTPVITSILLLSWGFVDTLGVVFLQWLSTFNLPVLQVARIFMGMVAIAGIISMVLGIYAEFLWAYLVACSLQSFLLAAALVALSIVYNQPLEYCAGLASSVEILFKHGAAPLYSMICTHALIHSGVQSYMNLQSVTYVVAVVFYMGFEILARPKDGKDGYVEDVNVEDVKGQ